MEVPGPPGIKPRGEADTRVKRPRPAMDARFVILLLSLAAATKGFTEEEVKGNEEWANRIGDMKICLEQENVTQEEMKEFLFNGKSEDDNEALKMAVYCFVKRINFFDGIAWNAEVIAESEAKNPEILKLINECLTKDDFTLAAHERAYQVQKCILEKGSLE